MATDHISATLAGLVRTLRNAPELQGRLSGVYDYYAYRDAVVLAGKLTIYAVVGDSAASEPFTNETTQTDILPTTFSVVFDTRLTDRQVATSSSGPSLLQMEYMVLRALQSDAWWGAQGNHAGWDVAGVVRNVPVIGADGDQDTDIRRTQIDLTVDCFIDRTDGPAR